MNDNKENKKILSDLGITIKTKNSPLNSGNKKYVQGYKFENELINKLKTVGFPLVIRTAGSHSPVDVMAFGIDQVYLFQCKSTKSSVITNELVSRTMRNKAVKVLTELPERYIKVLAFKALGNHSSQWIFYKWNNSEWEFIKNKLFD